MPRPKLGRPPRKDHPKRVIVTLGRENLAKLDALAKRLAACDEIERSERGLAVEYLIRQDLVLPE